MCILVVLVVKSPEFVVVQQFILIGQPSHDIVARIPPSNILSNVEVQILCEVVLDHDCGGEGESFPVVHLLGLMRFEDALIPSCLFNVGQEAHQPLSWRLFINPDHVVVLVQLGSLKKEAAS